MPSEHERSRQLKGDHSKKGKTGLPISAIRGYADILRGYSMLKQKVPTQRYFFDPFNCDPNTDRTTRHIFTPLRFQVSYYFDCVSHKDHYSSLFYWACSANKSREKYIYIYIFTVLDFQGTHSWMLNRYGKLVGKIYAIVPCFPSWCCFMTPIRVTLLMVMFIWWWNFCPSTHT